MMKQIIYSFPRVHDIIKESIPVATQIDTDTFEVEVFYHERTNTTFCFAGYPGEYAFDASAPFVEIYGTKRTVRKLERLMLGKKTPMERLFSQISQFLSS